MSTCLACGAGRAWGVNSGGGMYAWNVRLPALRSTTYSKSAYRCVVGMSPTRGRGGTDRPPNQCRASAAAAILVPSRPRGQHAAPPNEVQVLEASHQNKPTAATKVSSQRADQEGPVCPRAARRWGGREALPEGGGVGQAAVPAAVRGVARCVRCACSPRPLAASLRFRVLSHAPGWAAARRGSVLRGCRVCATRALLDARRARRQALAQRSAKFVLFLPSGISVCLAH